MLPLYKKIAYGMGRFGSSFLLSLTGLTSFYIYGARFELNWMLAGISLGLSYVVIGLTHWLTGYYSDKVNTRWGRRKPFVVIGAPGLALTGFLIFVPNWFMNTANPALELLVFAYYLTFLCSFKFFYAFLLTAFQAWLPEITDEEERPLVSSMQNVSNWVANGLGVVLGFITPLLFLEGPPPGLSVLGLSMILFFCVICVVFYLPSILFIREKPDIVIPERNLVEETRFVLKNKDYVGWTLVVGFLSFSFSAIVTQVVGFAEQGLQLVTIELLLPPALALLFGIMAFLFVWLRAIKVYGKKKTMYASLILLAILLPLTPVLAWMVPSVSGQLLAILWFIPMAAGMAVYYIMSYIVPADIAHVDEIMTGESRSGMYTGFIGVPLNVFQAAAAFMLGWFMDYSQALTGTDVFGLTWWGPLYAPFLLIAALLLRRVDIDPDFEALKSELSMSPERAVEH